MFGETSTRTWKDMFYRKRGQKRRKHWEREQQREPPSQRLHLVVKAMIDVVLLAREARGAIEEE
jgi:hypothetical protein